MDTDRNLLFAVLALQADLIDSPRFVEGCTLWASQKQTALADLLVQRSWLTDADRADIERLLERTLKKHSGDARAGLAEVTTDGVKQSLAGLADAEIHQSLAGLATPEAPGRVLLSTSQFIPEARDRYTLTRLHAKGGIGRVWLARDASLGRDVALKELLPDRASQPTVWTRFLKEAQVTGQLEHPGIVPIYEVGKRPEDDAPYYTMRFVRGRTLAEAVEVYHRRRTQGEAGPLELRQLLGALVGVCNAVAYAHSRGVLHRDLKPQNVVLGDYGEVVLLDWGLARLLDQADSDSDVAPLALPASSSDDATVQGQVLGTPAYMAPEQAEGRLDLLAPATDVYGLGAILYQVLTGKPPFTETDTLKLLRRVVHDAPTRPRLLVPGVPAALEAVCLKALAKKPAERFGSAGQLADEVQRWLAGEPVSVYRDPLLTRLGRWARKHRNVVTAAAALLQTAVVVLAVSVVLIGRSRAQVDHERRRSEAVNNFLVKDLLTQANPEMNPAGDKLTVRELLDKSAAALDTTQSMTESPEVEGAVRSALGNTYLGLGLYQRAREQLEKAVTCQDRGTNIPASERTFTKNRLCFVRYKLGSFDERPIRQVFAQACAELGRDHEETIYAADTLATITLGNKNRNEAFSLYRENLAIQQRLHGPDHLLTIRAALSYADALMANQQGDEPRNLDEALTVMLAARDAALRLSPNDTNLLMFEIALGFLYARRGEFTLARQVLAPLQERFQKVLGQDHIEVALYSENLALAEEGLGNLEAAEGLLLRAHAVRKKLLGDGHGLTRRATAYLGRVCMARGKQTEAAAWLRALLSAGVVRNGTGIALPIGINNPIPEPPGLADLSRLGEVLSGKGDPALSVQILSSELLPTLEWLTWSSDWLRHYVKVLLLDATYRTGNAGKETLLGMMDNAISAMQSNRTTPRDALDRARAWRKQVNAGVLAP
jgi:tetratricopeptide (TPR) repeat protein